VVSSVVCWSSGRVWEEECRLSTRARCEPGPSGEVGRSMRGVINVVMVGERGGIGGIGGSPRLVSGK
jgi:hypothetical protein